MHVSSTTLERSTLDGPGIYRPMLTERAAVNLGTSGTRQAANMVVPCCSYVST
ncbi:hypothetical protein DPMN_011192 [Dreissena polymorpha]|uniref:Uncharacterized protein n=1 Tax=Dreissena polymorpha TaxID=45954 RepID=A0A9D4RZZ9_DREPO|nr:hypothetical protein DPMN_011192 [Dreissena polymorpha]